MQTRPFRSENSDTIEYNARIALRSDEARTGRVIAICPEGFLVQFDDSLQPEPVAADDFILLADVPNDTSHYDGTLF